MLLSANKIILIASSIYLVTFFALGSGLFNSILEGSDRLSGSFIIPSRSIQTVAETVVMIIIFLLGTSGVYLLYKAGISQASIKNQGALMAAGFVIIGIALVLGFRIVDIKLWWDDFIIYAWFKCTFDRRGIGKSLALRKNLQPNITYWISQRIS